MNAEGLPARARRSRPGDPQWIGPYEVVGFLGEGGMGLVFVGRGRDGVLVAIKVVREDLARYPEFRARFRREAQSAMRVPRFCTAEVLAADPNADAPYLVTEYIDGPTLEEAVTTGGRLRGAELDQLGVSMAAALASIHLVGVMHRDLKPSNVLLSRVGPRVIDFGVAGAVDATRLTEDGKALGTPAYMAPEQLQARPVPESDVFSWGGVMVFAATGRRPFGGDSLPMMAARIMHAEPDLTGLTGPLRDVVAAAMRKDPVQRPTSAQLLELLGVSGKDPERAEQAVRTRLEGLASPAPDPLLTDQTRTDLTHTLWGPVAGAADAVRPATSSAQQPRGGDPAPPRHGSAADPGNSLPDGWQTTWTPPPRAGRSRLRRRIRSLTVTVVSVAVIGGAIAWLLLRDQPADLVVTGVDVQVDKRKQGCNADVDVMGILTTNGAPGQIIYQWKRSDQKSPDSPREQNMDNGRKQATVHLFWEIKGSGTHTFTATLTILNNSTIHKSTTFTYSCKG